jgi:imidazolonepropionase-like amidohydrolase
MRILPRQVTLAICGLLIVAPVISAQNVQREGGLGGALPRPVRQVATPTGIVYLRCGALWDGKSDQPRSNVVITVEGERIKDIGAASPPSGATVIDLSAQTCLPGLIDTHTHVFLQGDRKPGQYDAQLLKQSVAYRTIEATAAARQMLDYGFTAIRDLETEGAGYADADVRDAINAGVVAGPRMQVATRAMDVTGAYPLAPAYSWDVQVPIGVQTVDGAEGGRKAVREQISHGADWIKVYADRGGMINANGVIEDIPTFTLEELRAIADETHRQRHKMAAHATGINGVHNAVEAGADTIEHGNYIAPEDMKTMVARGVFYVPTLYVAQYDAELRAGPGVAPQETRGMHVHGDTFHRAVQAGVKVAFGTDAGAFEWDVNPAREFPLMVKYGMTPAQALRSATVVAAELLGMQEQIGSVEAGKFADIIAIPGNPLGDVGVLQKVGFVMKGGVVFKK